MSMPVMNPGRPSDAEATNGSKVWNQEKMLRENF